MKVVHKCGRTGSLERWILGRCSCRRSGLMNTNSLVNRWCSSGRDDVFATTFVTLMRKHLTEKSKRFEIQVWFQVLNVAVTVILESNLRSNLRSAGATGRWSSDWSSKCLLLFKTNEASFLDEIKTNVSAGVKLLFKTLPLSQFIRFVQPSFFLFVTINYQNFSDCLRLKSTQNSPYWTQLWFYEIQRQTFFNDYIQSRKGK